VTRRRSKPPNAVYLDLRYPITLTYIMVAARLGLGPWAEFSVGYRAGSGAPTLLCSETPQRITASRARGDIGRVASDQYLP